MSRSYRKPWYNDVGISKDVYWKTIRRKWKVEIVNSTRDEDFEFTHQKNIINDYDYSDYCFNIAKDPKGSRK